VTLSASEAERFGTAEGGTYAVFMTAIITRFGHSLEGPVHMHMDRHTVRAEQAHPVQEGLRQRAERHRRH